MSERDGLTERFEESRPHLRAVAYRMLGSASEAEDAVQETWLRLHLSPSRRSRRSLDARRKPRGSWRVVRGGECAGEIEKLVTMLDPEVVFRADSAAMRGRPAREVRGAAAVAKLYSGRAQGAGTGLLDGAVGIVVAPLGRLVMVIHVTFAGGRIAGLDVVADPEKLREVEIAR